MSLGIKKVVSCINAARSAKDVAAILVPRHFARSLVDELYPSEVALQATGVSFIDEVRFSEHERREEDRRKYHELVDAGGYVGKIFGYPMVVADDVVLCALSEEETVSLAEQLGYSLGEVLKGRCGDARS